MPRLIPPLAETFSFEIEQRIARLRSLSLTLASTPEIAKLVGEAMHGYACQPLPLRVFYLFRGRVSGTDELFKYGRELWYPPAERIGQAGRFNHAKEQVLYAGTTANTALHEIQPQPGEWVTIIRVVPKEAPTPLLTSLIGLNRAALGVFSGRPMPRNPNLESQLAEARQVEKWKLIDNCLSGYVTEPMDRAVTGPVYRVTNAIKDLLWKIPGNCGITYPSVSRKLHGLNVCIKPEIADALFAPSEAWQLQINEFGEHPSGGPFFSFAARRWAKISGLDNLIDWQETKTCTPLTTDRKPGVELPRVIR